MKPALGIVLVCLGLPPAFVLVSGASHYRDNRTTARLEVAGDSREYVVHVPAGYDGSKPVPLVLSLHGAGTWPSLQKNLSGWNAVADTNNFIVAYPGGAGVAFKVFSGRDLQLLVALIDKLQSQFNIDHDRIYVNGLSNGGGTSYALSCVISDRIAAVGAVGPAITMSADMCPDADPVPVVVFHGTADTFTPYEGGKVWIAPKPFPDIREWIGNWARRNHCASTTRESQAAAGVTRIEYENCEESVVLYKIAQGGHTWPGGMPLPEWFVGETNDSINATELMWSFFKDRSLRH